VFEPESAAEPPAPAPPTQQEVDAEDEAEESTGDGLLGPERRGEQPPRSAPPRRQAPGSPPPPASAPAAPKPEPAPAPGLGDFTDADDMPDWLSDPLTDETGDMPDWLAEEASKTDLDAMTPDEVMAWMESLAKRRGMPEEPTPEAEEAAEPEPAKEDVFFTLYHPKEAEPEKWYTLLIYAHVQAALAQVQQNAAKFSDEMNDDPREVRAKHSVKLARGTEIRVEPHAEGVTFNPPSATITWNEDYERVNFRFQAPADLSGQPMFGEVGIYVGPLLISTVRFSVFVTEAISEPAAPLVPVSAQMYRRIFASYSHRDTEIVNACLKAFDALGDEVYIDYRSLRSGEQWSEALERLIEEADVFQLFWSEHAATSDHVRHEWTHALKHRQGGVHFIRPVYWQQPMPDVPPELSHLHFKYMASFVGD
jgi:hypothetical protein